MASSSPEYRPSCWVILRITMRRVIPPAPPPARPGVPGPPTEMTSSSSSSSAENMSMDDRARATIARRRPTIECSSSCLDLSATSWRPGPRPSMDASRRSSWWYCRGSGSTMLDRSRRTSWLRGRAAWCASTASRISSGVRPLARIACRTTRLERSPNASSTARNRSSRSLTVRRLCWLRPPSCAAQIRPSSSHDISAACCSAAGSASTARAIRPASSADGKAAAGSARRPSACRSVAACRAATSGPGRRLRTTARAPFHWSRARRGSSSAVKSSATLSTGRS